MATLPELPTFNLSPSTLLDIATDLANQVRQAANDLVNHASPQNATFENTLRPLADIDNELKGKVQYLALFQAVSPSSEMRNASSAAVNLVDKAYLGIFQTPSLFALVNAVYKNYVDTKSEDQKLLNMIHSMFMENGLHLEGDKRDRFLWISNRLIELRVAFMGNLSSDPGYVWKEHYELEGISTESLQALPMHSSTSQRGIKLKKPDITMVLTRCHIAETRKEVFLRSQNIFPDNLEIFNEAVILRDESARLLGFSSFAAQKSRHKMFKSPYDIDQLLDELYNHLQPLAQKELETLQRLKMGDGGDGDHSSYSLYLWDFDYYHDRLLREKYDTNHELIAEYFPTEITIRGILKAFETISSLSIAPVEVTKEQIWHSDVRVFSVRDEQSAFLGYLYLDIYPREGKYNHAANFNICPSYSSVGKQKQPVATALVCNVSQPSSEKPGLLQHRELIMIFHELGHGIHDLLGRSNYATFHGHRTVADFVEAPSQLLEYWCWVPECLQMLSCHYSYVSDKQWPSTLVQPPKEIPESLVRSLIAAKKVNQGILTLRQLAFSKFDMQIHCPSSHHLLQSIRTGEIHNALLQIMTLLQGPENRVDWGNGHVTTSHYMWGQEANYYSYLYTRILAADLWFSNFHSNPMSRDAGLRYRKMILAPGGSQNEMIALETFLRRSPTLDAYLRDIGARE
ncbi:hypothetical protein PENSOL_c084G06051 [Penicillium solitum]|uniref:Peptidase M3A/M3B catalytic domain-containing protein n=1 Tax=Penicillium solitum TaxID=60172 RepID=A0A1V6QCB8_9EURO|nr:uncharacterized protein PENSOL_c084G06051 [Penicillium solitum]OQD86858.1 hypothetical protein PENSOL_c084G06051 [Penicillium solitum]